MPHTLLVTFVKRLINDRVVRYGTHWEGDAYFYLCIFFFFSLNYYCGKESDNLTSNILFILNQIQMTTNNC